MSLIAWSEVLKRGLSFQDADHEEAVRLMNALQTCTDEDLPALFAEHAAHLGEHLARENALMERIGFFAKDVHMGEHARVLEETAAMQAKLNAGDLSAVRAYVARDLPDWFIEHLESMDTMTALFAQQRGEH
jgi:hemerythrin